MELTNRLKKAWKSLMGEVPDELLTPLNPDAIDRDKLISELTKVAKAREVQLALLLADKNNEPHEKKTEELKNDMIDRSFEQTLEMRNKKYGNSFSLNKFYAKYFGVDANRVSKWGQNLEISDRTDAKVFGKFGELITLEGNRLAITNSEGEVMALGKTLHNIIYKPDSLPNQVGRNRILLPINVDGDPVPDLEEIEFPNIVYEKETDDYKVQEENSDKVSKLLIKREELIRRQSQKIELQEKQIADMSLAIDDMTRALNVAKHGTDVTKSELSNVMNSQLDFISSIGEMQRKIAHLTEVVAMTENIRDRLESVNKQIMDKAEQLGVKTDFEKINNYITETMLNLSKMMPERVPVLMNPQEIQKPLIEEPKKEEKLG